MDVFLSFVKDGVLKLPNQKSHACSSDFPQAEVACVFGQHHACSCAGYIFHSFFEQSGVLLTSFHVFVDCEDRLHGKTDVILVLCCSFQ